MQTILRRVKDPDRDNPQGSLSHREGLRTKTRKVQAHPYEVNGPTGHTIQDTSVRNRF